MARSTRERWAKRVSRWQESGLTCKEFAAKIGVNANTLSHWKWYLHREKRTNRKRVKRSSSDSKKPKPTKQKTHPMQFVDLSSVITSETAENRYEIEVGSRRLFIPAHFETDAVKRLIDILEAAQ